MTYEKNKIRFSRDPSQNFVMACKLTPATHRIPDRIALRDVIASFHMGCYAQPICLSDILSDHSSPGTLVKSCFKYDKHILKIIKDFCGCGRAILSINRISAEFQLFNHRFGIQLLNACVSLHKYLSELPGDSLAGICFSLNTRINTNLAYASHVIAPKIPKILLIDDGSHWSTAPKSIRKLAWRFFLTPDSHIFATEKIAIRRKLAQKEFCSLKKFLTEKIRDFPAPTL